MKISIAFMTFPSNKRVLIDLYIGSNVHMRTNVCTYKHMNLHTSEHVHA